MEQKRRRRFNGVSQRVATKAWGVSGRNGRQVRRIKAILRAYRGRQAKSTRVDRQENSIGARVRLAEVL